MTNSSDPMLPPPFIVGKLYLDRKGSYTVVAVSGDKMTIRRHTGEQEVATIAKKALIYRNILDERGELYPLGERDVTFAGGRPVNYSHDEVFPIIAATIMAYPGSTERFITHHQIVDALLENPNLRPFLERLEIEDPQHKAMTWWASNMLQWFSQVQSVRGSEWESKFEREEQPRGWAYRVRAPMRD